MKFTLPLVFDCKTKMLYHNSIRDKNSCKHIATFSIPDENQLILSIHNTTGKPMRENMLHAFACYTSNTIKTMGYVNKDKNVFKKYQYLINHNVYSNFQSYSLGYFDNIYDGFKSNGISTLSKTLLGCSSYENVDGNLCCLDCRCDVPNPEPFTMNWETISQQFNLNGINCQQNEKLNLQSALL